MRKRLFIVAMLAIGMAASFSSCKRSSDSTPDDMTVYHNAAVYTADANNSEATAFVVQSGKFVYVGNYDDAVKFAGEGAAKVDLQGRRVLPGLIDSHTHYFVDCANNSSRPTVKLAQFDSHEQTTGKIVEFAKNNPDETVIYGSGYGTNVRVTAAALDSLGIDRPIVLLSCDGHSVWTNSAGLKKAGVDENYKDMLPGASYFERDPKTNKPTGKIVETTQCFWYIQKVEAVPVSSVEQGIDNATRLYNGFGVTTIYDAGALVIGDEDALKVVKARPDNTMRLYTSIWCDGQESAEDFVSRATRLRNDYTTDRIHPTTFKAFKDGTNEIATSFMFEEFKAPFGTGHGNNMFTTEQFLAVTRPVADAGFNIHIHAIGDRAVSEILDVMSGLGKISGTKTIAHCQTLAGGALEKFIQNKDDVFYQTTPVWMYHDAAYVQCFGQEMYDKYDMPLKTVYDAGITLTFGSDGTASETAGGRNPMNDIYVATNQGGADKSIHDRPEQNLTVAQCIDAYTINCARQLAAENEIGSITVGKYADFVVLDRDILKIATLDIKNVTVLETYLNGVQVYRK